MIRSLLLLTFGGLLLLLAVRRLRQFKLKERFALLFVLLGVPFVALAVWPDAVAVVAELLEIDYRTAALLSVSAFLIMMVFELLTIVSQQDRKITTLAQTVAILMEHHRQAIAGAVDDKIASVDTPPRSFPR